MVKYDNLNPISLAPLNKGTKRMLSLLKSHQIQSLHASTIHSFSPVCYCMKLSKLCSEIDVYKTNDLRMTGETKAFLLLNSTHVPKLLKVINLMLDHSLGVSPIWSTSDISIFNCK